VSGDQGWEKIFVTQICAINTEKIKTNTENIQGFQLWAVSGDQGWEKIFVTQICAINTGKIITNTENIQGP